MEMDNKIVIGMVYIAVKIFKIVFGKLKFWYFTIVIKITTKIGFKKR